MSATLPPSLIGLLVALLLGGALAAVLRSRAPERIRSTSASTASVLSGVPRSRLAAAAVVMFAVLIGTGWVLLAAGAGVLVALWGQLLHDRRADDERARVEAIAKWLEDLRDTLRGSAIGAEDALEQVATRPPEAIAVPLHHFVLRRRQGFRTDDALADLADELAHPTADAAVAALRLVVGGSAGAGRLHGTVNALAAAARDEVIARERIDRTRAVYQQSMQRLVVIGAVLVGYLRIAAADLLRPYGTPVGQMVLALPLAMWAGCVMWLRALCRYELPERGHLAANDEVRS
jgi:predicted outer membrane lipoprotein